MMRAGSATRLFIAAGLAAVLSSGVYIVATDDLDTARQEISKKISVRRAALSAKRGLAASSAAQLLQERKLKTTSSVIVLEALSQILPDHTYVTELRIEGDKVQITGVTADAPSLIGLIEQSPHFTSATFFGPTTQTPGDPGERFHIEAHVKPDFKLGS